MPGRAISEPEIGDTTDPYVPTHVAPERTEIFARPSTAYPLATVDDDSMTPSSAPVDRSADPTTLFDRDEVPTIHGRRARTIDLDGARTTPARSSPLSIARQQAKRAVPPPFPSRERRVTPVELDESYRAALARLR